MKSKKNLFKLAILSSVFCLGVGLATFKTNNSFSKAKAEQYIDDYDPYTYSGNYYSGIDFNDEGGMNGSLRTSLTSLIIPKAFYTYSGKSGECLANILQEADEDPNNHNNMIYLYTRDSVAKNPANSWNREHCWPQSRSNGNWGESKGGTDILHLRPTYGSTNSSRGNKPYGDNNKSGAKTYNGMLYGYTEGSQYFEPLDQVKGDVARIIMYVWTAYTGYPGYNSLNILNVFESYDTLLRWHTMDKPDVLEGNRNDCSLTSKQKNRNPFVDHPELAWKIFGDNASVSVKNACMQAYPGEGIDPVDPTGITLNKETATVQVGKTVKINATLQPNGATGDITWSSSNTSIATVNSNGLVTGKAPGTATITATCSTFSASCTVEVTQGINYGSLTHPLTIEQAKEIIDINGSSLTNEPLYVKGTISSNSAFDTSYNNYLEIWLKSDDKTQDKDFELYRAVLDTSIDGNYSTENSLADCEIVAKGYGKKYNNKTYELCYNTDGDPTNPTILSLKAPGVDPTIELDHDTLEIDEGETATLVATVNPVSTPVTWETSDSEIATVDDGVVTAVSAGTATITAKVTDTIKAECVVTVIGVSPVLGDPVILDLTTDHTKIATEDEIAWDVNPVGTMSCIKYNSNTKANNYYGGNSDNRTSTRFYTGSKLTVTPADGITLLKIEFTATTASYASTFGNSAWTNAIAGGEGMTIDITPISGDSSISAVIGGTCGFSEVKFYYSGTGVTLTLEDYLDTASTFATLEATETNEGSGSGTNSFDFSTMGYSNEQVIGTVNLATGLTMTCAKGSGSNDPKYFNSGTSIRVYNGNTITFSCSDSITRIEFTFSTGSHVLNASIGNYSDGVWTGNATSITFTNNNGTGQSNQVRITSATVTYGTQSTSVSNAGIRFCGSMPRSSWEGIAEEHTISDYGVMLVKKNTLVNTYNVSSVEEAYNNGKTLSIIHKGSGDAPNSGIENCTFNGKINISKSSQYNVVICAAAFIVIDNEYYFLGEMEYSVNTLAQYHLENGGSDLSDTALNILAGN